MIESVATRYDIAEKDNTEDSASGLPDIFHTSSTSSLLPSAASFLSQATHTANYPAEKTKVLVLAVQQTGELTNKASSQGTLTQGYSEHAQTEVGERTDVAGHWP